VMPNGRLFCPRKSFQGFLQPADLERRQPRRIGNALQAFA